MKNPIKKTLLAAVAGGAMLGFASAASPVTVTAAPDRGPEARIDFSMADRSPKGSRRGHPTIFTSDGVVAKGWGEFKGRTQQPLWDRNVANDDGFGACSVFEDTFCPGFGGINGIERMWACAADSNDPDTATSCAMIGAFHGGLSAENSPTSMGTIEGAPYLFFYPGNDGGHENFNSDSLLTGLGIMSVPEPASLGLLGLGLLGLGAARRRSS